MRSKCDGCGAGFAARGVCLKSHLEGLCSQDP